MTGARLAGIVAAIIALAFGASLLWEHRPAAPSPELAVAAKVDTIRVQEAAKAETVYVAAKALAAAARADFRATRDSALRDLKDTAMTKRAFARADTAFVHDTVMLVAADTLVAKEKAVTAQVRTELAIALRPHPPKRLNLILSGLYDPVTATPLASAAVGFRVIGNVSAVAVVLQRVQVGDAPQVYVGVSVRF